MEYIFHEYATYGWMGGALMAYLEDDANFYMWCSQQLYSYFQMSQVVNLYQYR